MKLLPILLTVLFLSSCSSFQIRKKSDAKPYSQSSSQTSSEIKTAQSETPKVNPSVRSSSTYFNVAETAKMYLGTPYRSGGTSKSGMDCSGLVVTSFKEHGIDLPRVSRDQANAGKNISIHKVNTGDLLFFNTSGRGISHVGIVERIEGDEVFFVHASSSQGVTISSLENSYWKPRFVKAVRVE